MEMENFSLPHVPPIDMLFVFNLFSNIRLEYSILERNVSIPAVKSYFMIKSFFKARRKRIENYLNSELFARECRRKCTIAGNAIAAFFLHLK